MKIFFYIIIFTNILSFSVLAKKKLCVITVHGYGEYKDFYKGKLNSCTQNGAHVIYMGLKGFGPAEFLQPASAADWTRQIKAQVALARQSCEKVTLLGNSTGGALALNHAMNESLPPYNIDGLFLINPALNSPIARGVCEGAKLTSAILGPFSNLGFILGEVAAYHFRKKNKNIPKSSVVGRSRLACSVNNISKNMMKNYLTEAGPPCPQCSASVASINFDMQIQSAQNTYLPKIGYNISKRMPFSLVYSRGDKVTSGFVTERLTKQPGNGIDLLHISGKSVHNQVLSNSKQNEKLRNFCCKKEFNLNCKPFRRLPRRLPKKSVLFPYQSDNASSSMESNDFSAFGNSLSISKVNNNKNSVINPAAKSKVVKGYILKNHRLGLSTKGPAELTSSVGFGVKGSQFRKNSIVNGDLSQLREKIVKGQREINSSLFSPSKLYQGVAAIEDYVHIKNISKNSTQFCQLAYCPPSAISYFHKDREMSNLKKSDPSFFYTIGRNIKLRTKYKNQRNQTLKTLKPFVHDIQKIDLDAANFKPSSEK